MSLAADLLKQAEHLARREPRRPRQASLRRAISAAYYSLFHLLVEESTLRIIGGRPDWRGYRRALARGFTHQSMVEACKSFHGDNLPARVQASVGAVPVPPELRSLARVFVNLQEERHRADYDLTALFTRTQVLALIQQLDAAVAACRNVRKHEVSVFFLAALPVWRQLKQP